MDHECLVVVDVVDRQNTMVEPMGTREVFVFPIGFFKYRCVSKDTTDMVSYLESTELPVFLVFDTSHKPEHYHITTTIVPFVLVCMHGGTVDRFNPTAIESYRGGKHKKCDQFRSLSYLFFAVG